MKKLYLIILFTIIKLDTDAQSVYMHEAQEESGGLDFETFLYSLVIIIPGVLIWFLVSSFLNDKRVKKEQAIRQIEKQKEENRKQQYQRDSKAFYDKLNCRHIINVNGYNAVDLGLASGILWGAENIGAKNNFEVGDIYGWGDYEKININELSFKCHLNPCALRLSSNEEYEADKYDYDIAIKQRGAKWRTPTEKHFTELQNDCKWKYIDNFGVIGWKVIGPNGNFIFFPIKYKWHTYEDRSWKELYDMILLTSSFPEEDSIGYSEVGLSKNAYFYDINDSSHNIIIRSRVNCGYVRPIAYNSIDVKSDIDLALCYLKGSNVQKNVNRAIDILKKASEKNDPEAQRILGILYFRGQEIDKNIKLALSLLKLSGSQSNVRALRFLGDYYQMDNSIDKDIALAIKYYTIAGLLKDVKSILSLIKLFQQKENNIYFGNKQFDVFVEGAKLGIAEVAQISESWINRENHLDTDGIASYGSNGLRLVRIIADKCISGSTYNGHIVNESISYKTVESYHIKEGTRLICNYAFDCCERLKNLKIPSSVNFIGDYAFKQCMMLETIILPNSLIYIGEGAFDCDYRGISGVKRQNPIRICLPSSVEIINGNPFCYNSIIYSNNPLFKVIDNVLYSADGKELISYCSPKDEFTIPTGVVRIGNAAFRNSPIKKIQFPNSLEIIGKSAFESTELKCVYFPDSLKEINEKAFEWCHFHAGQITLSSNIKYIDPEAFNFGWFVKIIKVPQGRIEYYKSILPEWVHEQIVDEDVLYENGLYLNLERTEIISAHDTNDIIEIPEGINKVRNCAFAGIYNIESLKMPKTLTDCSMAIFDEEVSIGKIYVPVGCSRFFISKFQDFESIIEEQD